MMNPRRGDVVLVLFPNSDRRTAKRRPALVIQRDKLGSGLPQAIVAMISSNLSRRGHPSRVFVNVASPESRAAGLRLDSVIMTDNVTTVLESEIDSILGRWPDMTEIDLALEGFPSVKRSQALAVISAGQLKILETVGHADAH